MEVVSILLVAVVWGLCGFGIARENERVVKILLGRPYGTANPGWYWIPFGAAWVRRYTTKVVELQIAQRDAEGKVKRDENGKPVPAGGFITKRGTTTDDKSGPVNIGVSLSLRFNWPKEEHYLFECVRLLPPPDNIDELVNIFQEIVMDETRTVGCQMTYMGIMSQRVVFATRIKEQMVAPNTASELLTKTGLARTARVVIDHIDIPKETLEAIDDEEAERLRAEGVKKKAEGVKAQLRIEAEGRAEAIRVIKAEGEEGLELEGQRTLREMAQGPATTVFVPMDALKQLVKALTGKKEA